MTKLEVHVGGSFVDTKRRDVIIGIFNHGANKTFDRQDSRSFL